MLIVATYSTVATAALDHTDGGTSFHQAPPLAGNRVKSLFFIAFHDENIKYNIT